MPPLKELAALDACITVVDAANLMANLKSIKTLKVHPWHQGTTSASCQMFQMFCPACLLAELLMRRSMLSAHSHAGGPA